MSQVKLLEDVYQINSTAGHVLSIRLSTFVYLVITHLSNTYMYENTFAQNFSAGLDFDNPGNRVPRPAERRRPGRSEFFQV